MDDPPRDLAEAGLGRVINEHVVSARENVDLMKVIE